jgi:hypothetical protein
MKAKTPWSAARYSKESTVNRKVERHFAWNKNIDSY